LLPAPVIDRLLFSTELCALLCCCSVVLAGVLGGSWWYLVTVAAACFTGWLTPFRLAYLPNTGYE
jgi:hypothetical protein